MKKEDVSKIVYDVWNCMDQAGLDYALKELMSSAPIEAQIRFLERIIDSNNYDELPDENTLKKAYRLIGRQQNE